MSYVTMDDFKVPNTCGECKCIQEYVGYGHDDHYCCELMWMLKKENYKVDENTLDENCPLKFLNDALFPTAFWDEEGNCSSCGGESQYYERVEKQYDYDWDENLIECGEEYIREHELTDFCPHCGKKMVIKYES